MKKFYENPEIVILLLKAEDIMKQSDETEDDGDEDVNIRDDNEGPHVPLP